MNYDNLSTDELYDELLETGALTEEELNLVTDMNGYSERTLLDALYCRTGCRNLNQYYDIEEEEEEE